MLRRHLTLSNAVALLAIFLGLAGGVYAAGKVNGKQIKKASVAGNKLQPNALTGAQVDEGSLGQVPSAGRADTAATAANAQTIGGVAPAALLSPSSLERIRFDNTIPEGGGSRNATVLRIGPLRLDATCRSLTSGGPFIANFELTASTTGEIAGVDVASVSGPNANSATGFGVGTTPQVVLTNSVFNNEGRIVGTIFYNDPTATITIPFILFLNDTPTESRCFFTGTAVQGTS